MWLSFFKALHIVGFVAWFAGIFYLVRLFVYHKEALESDEVQTVLLSQYELMEKRLFYIITHPAMFLTWFSGLMMLYLYGWDWFKINIWLHYKIGLLILLTVYHFWMQSSMKKLSSNTINTSSFGFRLLNELPTILLVLIVFIAVFRSSFSLLYGLLSFLGLGVIFFVAAKLYKSRRDA
jgi:putative membrane protein